MARSKGGRVEPGPGEREKELHFSVLAKIFVSIFIIFILSKCQYKILT